MKKVNQFVSNCNSFQYWLSKAKDSSLVQIMVQQFIAFTICPNQSHLQKKGRESLKLVSQKGLRKWNTENFRQPLADSQTWAKVSIPTVLQMTDILFIQSIGKSNHFRFLVLCNLPPLRFTTILGHLIKCVLKPFEMSRQHLQTKQKNYRFTASERNEDKDNKRDQGKKSVYFPLADSLIVAELKSKNSNEGNDVKFSKALQQ